MSLLGSLNAAVGGMNAQSASIGNISDNIANSQTVGFKETDTAFVDHLTDSSASTHAPGAVVARPVYTNANQGSVTQVNNPTSLAVSGQGFFAVKRTTNGQIVDPNTTYYTRVGDFAVDQSGHLVNSTGYALEGWKANDSAGKSFATGALETITINKSPSQPAATSKITLAANIPATTTTATSNVQVYDSSGATHGLTLSWAKDTSIAGKWNLTVAKDSAPGTAVATASATFNADGTPSVDPSATLNLSAVDPSLSAVQFNLSGVTQFAGSDYQVSSLTKDGNAQGNFSSVAIQPSGNVIINYDNGTSVVKDKIPLTAFNDPNALQQQDGQAFTATLDSGTPNTSASGQGGTGKLIVGAQESSNVDIAAQFTQMIVAQRAYTANTKVISTANQLLQDTLNMVQG